jgi:SAM-dependent methyltransferase
MTSLEDLTYIPMHRRRPECIEVAIDRDQAEARKFSAPPIGYSFEGEEDDYRFIGPDKQFFYASELLTADDQLRILDIGAGQGGFVLRAQQMGHIAHALTLHDYRGVRSSMIADRVQPGSYIVGNAERLDEVDGLLDQYDIVVSSMALWWMADPLGALEQAADRVAPDGKLVADRLPLGYGLRRNDHRLQARIGNAEVKAELIRVGFSDTTLVNGGKLKNVYAQRSVGDTAAKAAFALGYELPASGAGWRYISTAPVIDHASL